MIKRAIVFGATGKTGSKICEQLNERNIQHIAFIRKESEEKLKSIKTELFYGNVFDNESILKALKTNDFTDVVIALGSRDFKNYSVRSKGTKHIVEALNKLSINCTIHVVSALGVNDSWSQLNWLNKLICNVLIKSAMKDHGLQEDAVVNSNVKFHIVRPVALTDGKATGIIHNQTEGFLPNNDIAREDVAKYLVDCLLEGVTGFSSICRGRI